MKIEINDTRRKLKFKDLVVGDMFALVDDDTFIAIKVTQIDGVDMDAIVINNNRGSGYAPVGGATMICADTTVTLVQKAEFTL